MTQKIAEGRTIKMYDEWDVVEAVAQQIANEQGGDPGRLRSLAMRKIVNEWRKLTGFEIEPESIAA